MARLLTVLVEPDSRLRQVAKPVDRVDDVVRRLMGDMLKTMYSNDGIGLAAIQVGIAKRVVVMDVPVTDANEQDRGEGGASKVLKMANPELTYTSKELVSGDEGCLSVPGQKASITRHKSICVRYLDEYHQQQELEAEGLLSICIQHEIDHLDGKLFIDYLSSLKRSYILKKLHSRKKELVEA